MPFDAVLPVLGTCFVVAWVFIGGLMVSDTLRDARRSRVDGASDVPPHHFA
ncbi:hypothetical protein [Aeoliella mucimassa]|uniref:Uncharacterized protein n=1 Tax=Aeoliella mucimassa TaxID=2527972 RepID=A0A518AI28_9BACT|nr:hypothetical protein [Aeoliella mucimassa]QDU54380.1 hypothetical protein Pan181_05610 [Aeoliella mucimassa]